MGKAWRRRLRRWRIEILGVELAKIKRRPRRYGIHALFDRQLGFAQRGDGGRRGGDSAARGGALAKAIGAHLLQTDAKSVVLRDGAVHGRSGRVTLAEIAHTWYRARRIFRPLSIRAGSRRRSAISRGATRGTFSYAAHVATVAVDPETGEIEILDYVIVEDGGKLINPMVVDGQIYGGFAQGIGTALYEEMNFDASGQPLASTFADYLLPGPTEVPAPRLRHMETPCALHGIWREGARRRRRHRAAGRDRQCGQRRACGLSALRSSIRR